MNHFVERLPWRIAALAGLLVGGISLLTGAGPWTCLLRVAAAFAVFGAAGLPCNCCCKPTRRPPDSGAAFRSDDTGGQPG